MRAVRFLPLGALAILIASTAALDAQSPVQNPVPITGLPSATVPLSGTEAVPLVQNGETAQAPASAFGSVLSVFGRVGAVIAQSGDYAFSEISGTTTPAQLPIDGATITSTGTEILVATSTPNQLGAASADNHTLTSTNGVFSAVTSTTSTLGVAKPDGTTISASNGVYTTKTTTVAGTACVPGSSCQPNVTGLAGYSASTWTPAITTTGTVGTPSYGYNVGSYEQIGRTVIARFSINLSGWSGSPSGNVEIAGLPVASANTSNDAGSCVLGEYTVNGLPTTTYGITAEIPPNSTTAVLFSNGNTTSNTIPAADIGTTATLIGVCFYHT